jgi:hypothetical protein
MVLTPGRGEHPLHRQAARPKTDYLSLASRTRRYGAPLAPPKENKDQTPYGQQKSQALHRTHAAYPGTRR